METVPLPQWSEAHYSHAQLPRLKMTEEISRRDSITSSKTGDSGYHSDPEISLSPLDFRPHAKGLADSDPTDLPTPPTITLEPSDFEVHQTIHCTPPKKRSHGSILLNNCGRRPNSHGPPRPQVTSCPVIGDFTSIETEQKPDWSAPLIDQCLNDVDACHRTNAFKDPVETGNKTSLDVSDLKLKSKLRVEDKTAREDAFFPFHNRPEERVHSISSISTSGSGGDYSVTDDSDFEDDSEERTMLSKATLTTIDLILRKVELNLRHAAYVQCAGGANSRSSGVVDSSRSRRGSAQGQGVKRRTREDGLPPDDEDDQPNKRRRTSVTTTEDSESGPRFACPFYKHDPNRYRNRRTCPGPGWPTVHRMKEHLYRSHAQPIFCPRCYVMFDADIDLSNHLRSEPCPMSDPQPLEGIDRETLLKLHKRSPPLRLEEDKWRDVYQTLFPDVSEADIPSPYYDSDSPSEESRRFRRELLQRVRRELFATAEQEQGAVEQNLLRQVADIIQRCEADLLSSFRSAPNSNNPNPPATSRGNDQPSRPGFPPPSTLPRVANSVPQPLHEWPGNSFPPIPGYQMHRSEEQYIDAGVNPQHYQSEEFDFGIDWSTIFEPKSQNNEHLEPSPFLNTPVYT